MIFQHTYEQVLSGEKTQTRRIKKAGQIRMRFDFGEASASLLHGEAFVCDDKTGRVIYQAGKTYAVQPGRGKPAVARICITDIREQDVREISDKDAWAEGFIARATFLETWTQMHDLPALGHLMSDHLAREHERQGLPIPAHVWATWMEYLHSRPAERYQAWVLEFELVQS